MNKKGHHEIGFAPYAFLAAGISLIFVFLKTIFSKIARRSR